MKKNDNFYILKFNFQKKILFKPNFEFLSIILIYQKKVKNYQ